MSIEIKHQIANGQARPTEAEALGRVMSKRTWLKPQPREQVHEQIDFSNEVFAPKTEIPNLVEKLHAQFKFNQLQNATISVESPLTKKEKTWIQQQFSDLKVSITFITNHDTTQIKIER